MALFNRKSEAAPAAPAKRGRSGVTCGELNAAIAAVRDVLDPCTTRKTLETLWVLTNDAADGDIVKLEGAPPVGIADLDDALAEAQELGLSTGTLTALRRVRAQLAREQSARAAEPPQFVTVAQLKAHDANLFDAFSWALGAMAEELNRGQPAKAHVLEMLKRSANSAERKMVLAGIREFREADVPKMTQEQWLRYQSYGPGGR